MQPRKAQYPLFCRTINCNVTFRVALFFTITAIAALSLQAQTFTVIHNFSGGGDGANPEAGLTMTPAGTFYGTATIGGQHGYGTVFQMARRGSIWVVTPLYAFTGGADGISPASRAVLGPGGSLYSTTSEGGGGPCVDGNDQPVGCGTVFKLLPPVGICKSPICYWIHTVLYRFNGGTDGATPGIGDVALDRSGNVYGTTVFGGYQGYCFTDIFSCGVVYEVTPAGAESVLHTFTGPPDGMLPFSGVIFDSTGNLYGATSTGGTGGGNPIPGGIVYQLAHSGSSWNENVLFNFPFNGLSYPDGTDPVGGLILDSVGNLYGTTVAGGSGGGGTVFRMTRSGGSFTILANLATNGGVGPYGSLVMDAAGNLYGTTLSEGAFGQGNVFKLTPSNGSWTYTSLHDFTGGADGANPYSTVILDSSGNLYGTASLGGNTGAQCDPTNTHQCGLIWEITQ